MAHHDPIGLIAPLAGLAQLGLDVYLPRAIQAPIIVTVHAPEDSRYEFKRFYTAVKQHGYILYPGKLTTVETFRVGCMGQLGSAGMTGAIEAIRMGLADLGIDLAERARNRA